MENALPADENSTPFLPTQHYLVRLFHQLCDAVSFGFWFGKDLLMFVGVMLMHLPLVLLKIEFVDARARAYLERLYVACLISHDDSFPRSDGPGLRLLIGRCFGLRHAQPVTINLGREVFVIAPLDSLVYIAAAKQ